MTINIYKTSNVMHQSLPQSPQSAELKEVLENYVAGLQDLTDSAKVPINILTMIAEENKIVASEIVRIIEVRLQTAQPEHRLATLHLLDSIIKNVKEPYLSLFAQNIVTNFITTFNVVNIKTQESMLRLLQTWKEIYPIQYAQISALISSRATPKFQVQSSPALGTLPVKSYQQIQENINQKVNLPTPVPLPIPFTAPPVAPQPTIPFIGTPAPQIPFVSPQAYPQQYYPPSQLNQNELLQKLYDRLREQLMASQIASFQSSVPPQNLPPTPSPLLHSLSTPSVPNFVSDQPKQTQNLSHYHQQKPKSKRSPTRSPTHSSIRSPTRSPTSRSPTHPSTRSPTHSTRSPTRSPPYSSSRSTHSPPHSFSQRTHLVDLKDQTDIDNKNKTFSIGTSFSADVLKRKHSHVINNLYNASWSQCPTCAYRFADPNKLSDHLDWHFKMNRREKEKYKKPLSREWFSPVDEWVITENPESLQKPSAPGFFDVQSTEETKEKKKVKTIVKINGFGVSCPVCLEGFESFYDSEEDEWMYKDAVEIDGVLYHDACSPDQPFEGLGKRQDHPTSDRDYFTSKQIKLDY